MLKDELKKICFFLALIACMAINIPSDGILLFKTKEKQCKIFVPFCFFKCTKEDGR